MLPPHGGQSSIFRNTHSVSARRGNGELAFQFDQEGKPRVIAEFVSERDKCALLCIAQAFIAEFMRETGRGALGSLRRTDAA